MVLVNHVNQIVLLVLMLIHVILVVMPLKEKMLQIVNQKKKVSLRKFQWCVNQVNVIQLVKLVKKKVKNNVKNVTKIKTGNSILKLLNVNVVKGFMKLV